MSNHNQPPVLYFLAKVIILEFIRNGHNVTAMVHKLVASVEGAISEGTKGEEI